MPDGADAVVMVELSKVAEADGKSTVTFDTDDLPAGKHMMRKATNFRRGQAVFQEGHQIRGTDVGLLAETGAATVKVRTNPGVAILPTGDELVDCEQQPGPAQIRNSNGPMLIAMAESLGLNVINLGIGRDEPSQLESLVTRGLENDLLILTGGVSMGEFDLVPGILSKLGVQQVFHKVAVKPGKPIWFGSLEHPERPRYVFGLPGNPVSSLVGFHLFVRTAIRLMTGSATAKPSWVSARLSKAHETRGDRPTYWPSRWIADESFERRVEPLVWRGSSDLMALGQADSLTYFEAGTKTHPAGEIVQVFSL